MNILNSFLMKLGYCWHKWSIWTLDSNHDIIKSNNTRYSIRCEKRHCKKCAKNKFRHIVIETRI